MGQRFHDYVIVILVGVIVVVGGGVVEFLINKVVLRDFTDYSALEVWWTILPGVVLVFIAYPSLRLLYYTDEIEASRLRVGVVGHQWY